MEDAGDFGNRMYWANMSFPLHLETILRSIFTVKNLVKLSTIYADLFKVPGRTSNIPIADPDQKRLMIP